MQKMIKMYTNRKNGEVINEREFQRLAKEERKDFKPTPRPNYKN